MQEDDHLLPDYDKGIYRHSLIVSAIDSTVVDSEFTRLVDVFLSEYASDTSVSSFSK